MTSVRMPSLRTTAIGASHFFTKASTCGPDTSVPATIAILRNSTVRVLKGIM
jgi:hypothetical protein